MRAAMILGAAFIMAACTDPAATEAPPVAPPAPEPTPAVEARTDLATVTAPVSGARVTSPLSVTGVAPADWFFENQFPVRLVDAVGHEIAAAPATPGVNWTEPGPKEYSAELTFTATGPATLILEEDMPGDGVAPREVRIPVVLE